MRVREAVILAAGMGTRLKQRGQQAPKGFITLGERPIIEESLDRLVRASIDRVTIVTGHLAHFYEALEQRHPGLVHTVHNPRYADSGSMYSLSLVETRVAEDFLLLESDLIYEQRALTTLQEGANTDAILLSGFTQSGDEVYVETRNGMLVNMSKRRAALGQGVAGELVGISRVSQPLFRAMLDIAHARFKTDLRVDYETDCFVAVAATQSIPCPVVPDLLWSEIDDEAHYQRASTRIYPQIRARDWKNG